MRSHFVAALALVALSSVFAACAPSDPDAVEQDEATDARGRAIIGGSKASGFPEAVLVDMKQNGQIVSYCSGSLIAPKVVLTAGHCVHEITGFTVKAPYASGQKANASSSAVYDWTNDSEFVDPNQHDIGLVFLDTAITLAQYPTLATTPLADGAQVVNVGRINNGSLSTTDLFASKPLAVKSAKSAGFPFDYIAAEIIESGDSGGPDFAAGTHTIVAVNSGGGGGTEVLARVDLLSTWIQQQIAAHGGSGGGGTPPSACAHPICASGAKLTASCDPCAQKVCAADAFCCNNTWDAQCVSEVKTICAQTTCSSPTPPPPSGNTCSHNICAAGAKLTSTCDPCVKKICAVDAFCCNNTWDAQCAGEVQTICAQSCN